MSTAAPSPQVPGREEPKLESFACKEVPIQAVTVFCKNKAEVTRVINFSSPSSLGRHEVSYYSSNDIPGETIPPSGPSKCWWRLLERGHHRVTLLQYLLRPPRLSSLQMDRWGGRLVRATGELPPYPACFPERQTQHSSRGTHNDTTNTAVDSRT